MRLNTLACLILSGSLQLWSADAFSLTFAGNSLHSSGNTLYGKFRLQNNSNKTQRIHFPPKVYISHIQQLSSKLSGPVTTTGVCWGDCSEKNISPSSNIVFKANLGTKAHGTYKLKFSCWLHGINSESEKIEFLLLHAQKEILYTHRSSHNKAINADK